MYPQSKFGTGTCRDKEIMILIRCMFSFKAQLNINILLQRLHGYINLAADVLSRLHFQHFKELFPSADPSPMTIDR